MAVAAVAGWVSKRNRRYPPARRLGRGIRYSVLPTLLAPPPPTAVPVMTVSPVSSNSFEIETGAENPAYSPSESVDTEVDDDDMNEDVLEQLRCAFHAIDLDRVRWQMRARLPCVSALPFHLLSNEIEHHRDAFTACHCFACHCLSC